MILWLGGLYVAVLIVGGLAMAVDWASDGARSEEISGRVAAMVLWPVILPIAIPVGAVYGFGAFGKWYVKRRKALAEAREAARAYRAPDTKDYRGTEVK